MLAIFQVASVFFTAVLTVVFVTALFLNFDDKEWFIVAYNLLSVCLKSHRPTNFTSLATEYFNLIQDCGFFAKSKVLKWSESQLLHYVGLILFFRITICDFKAYCEL